DSGPDAVDIIAHIDKRLLRQGSSLETITQIEYKRQTSAKVEIGNAITSLKYISKLKWEDIFEELSIVNKILKKDPAETYPNMDFKSRDYYRGEIAKLADKSG